MNELEIHHRPKAVSPVMVLGFTGWMDGGSVSTGTVSYLADRLNASPFAAIKPHDFYILNFPTSTARASPASTERQQKREEEKIRRGEERL